MKNEQNKKPMSQLEKAKAELAEARNRTRLSKEVTGIVKKVCRHRGNEYLISDECVEDIRTLEVIEASGYKGKLYSEWLLEKRINELASKGLCYLYLSSVSHRPQPQETSFAMHIAQGLLVGIVLSGIGIGVCAAL